MHETDSLRRFHGIERLYSAPGLARLQASHVCVVGIGGVGSWAAEALARAGIGRLTLVDLDEICVSNINRQLHALDSTIGRFKVNVMAERIRAINSSVLVNAHPTFFTETSAEGLLAPGFDYVIDAIDSTAKKCLLIALCHRRGTRIIVAGGAGGRKDPTAVRIADLARSTHDPLLEAVRSRLRKEHGFPKGGVPFGLNCVYSTEPVLYSQSADATCATKAPGLRLDCENGYGSACHVTGTFGFAAAGCVIREIADGHLPPPS